MKDMEKIIARAASASPEEQVKIIEQLDGQGIFMLPEETWAVFIKRVSSLLQALREFDNGKIPAPLQGEAKYWKKVPQELMVQANLKLMKDYKCNISWVPCFFSSKETGPLAAGVELEVDESLPLIFIHDAFENRKIHCGYDGNEVLAHELTHAARMFFPLSCYEEYFTCHLYKSFFRRWLGNFFRNKYLLLLMVTGFFPGVIFLACGIAWGGIFFALGLMILLYEIHLHIKLKKAAKKLLQLKLDPLPVLLRLTDKEIFSLAKFPAAGVLDLEKSSLRWQVFFKKFHI